MDNLTQTWVYLSASPLLHLTLTLLAFQGATWVFERYGRRPILNPVLLSVIGLTLILALTQTSYETYFEGAQFVHFLLGPATVALAIPLYRQWQRVKASVLAILVSLVTGSVAAILSAILVAKFLGAAPDILATLAPKSATAPVAMAVSKELGGVPSLTAVVVIVTGIFGAMFGPLAMDLTGIRDWSARGLAIGTASHGIGTARALQVHETAGAFAALAMGLNALATALLVPLLWGLLSGWLGG